MNKYYHFFLALYGEISCSTNLTLEEVIEYIINKGEAETMFDLVVDVNQLLQNMDDDSLYNIPDADLADYATDEEIQAFSEYVLDNEYNNDITDDQLYFSDESGKLVNIGSGRIVSEDGFCELFKKKWKEIYGK